MATLSDSTPLPFTVEDVNTLQPMERLNYLVQELKSPTNTYLIIGGLLDIKRGDLISIVISRITPVNQGYLLSQNQIAGPIDLSGWIYSNNTLNELKNSAYSTESINVTWDGDKIKITGHVVSNSTGLSLFPELRIESADTFEIILASQTYHVLSLKLHNAKVQPIGGNPLYYQKIWLELKQTVFSAQENQNFYYKTKVWLSERNSEIKINNLMFSNDTNLKIQVSYVEKSRILGYVETDNNDGIQVLSVLSGGYFPFFLQLDTLDDFSTLELLEIMGFRVLFSKESLMLQLPSNDAEGIFDLKTGRLISLKLTQWSVGNVTIERFLLWAATTEEEASHVPSKLSGSYIMGLIVCFLFYISIKRQDRF